MAEHKDDNVQRNMAAWLAARMPAWRDVEILGRQIPQGAGNSAETSVLSVAYLEDGAARRSELVLRRQLEGHDIFLNSDLNLPFNMMKAVGERSSVPVPKVIGIEFDRAILGSPFLVMEAVAGKVVPQNPNYNVSGWVAELEGEQQRKLWRNAIEAMAGVNKIEWREGFDFLLAKPERGAPGLAQYMNDLNTWYRWAANGRRLPIFETGLAYLNDNQPADMPVCVLWGDSHVSNILFRDDQSVAAVLDWEAAALGTPEVDFGYWLFFDEVWSTGSGVPRLAALPGREEMISWYEQALGRPVRDLNYFEVLGAMRFSICLLRFADRMIALGQIPETTKAGEQNPATHIMAAKLGIAPPGDLEDFFEMNSAVAASKSAR